MGNFFGLDVKDLVELAKTLEEKAKEGEIKTSFEVRSGGMSNIPRQGNIPRGVGRNSHQTHTGQTSQESNFTVQSPKTDGVKESQPQQQTNSTTQSPVSYKHLRAHEK